MEHEDNSDANCSWALGTVLLEPGKKTGKSGVQRKNQDHLDHSIAKISKDI